MALDLWVLGWLQQDGDIHEIPEPPAFDWYSLALAQLAAGPDRAHLIDPYV